LAEGTWSCTSLEAPQEEELNEQLQDAEDGPQGFDLNVVRDVDDEVDDALNERNEDVLQGRANTLSRDEESGQQIPVASRNKQEKELKKLRKSDNIENMMGRYLEMRSKQVEYESATGKGSKRKGDKRNGGNSKWWFLHQKVHISYEHNRRSDQNGEGKSILNLRQEQREYRNFHMCLWSRSRISFDLAKNEIS
jgi:hypothetical protein